VFDPLFAQSRMDAEQVHHLESQPRVLLKQFPELAKIIGHQRIAAAKENIFSSRTSAK
jgi:hypothetical protein